MRTADMQIGFTIQNGREIGIIVHEEGRDTPATRR
jgi:hypothetical protein